MRLRVDENEREGVKSTVWFEMKGVWLCVWLWDLDWNWACPLDWSSKFVGVVRSMIPPEIEDEEDMEEERVDEEKLWVRSGT